MATQEWAMEPPSRPPPVQGRASLWKGANHMEAQISVTRMLRFIHMLGLLVKVPRQV